MKELEENTYNLNGDIYCRGEKIKSCESLDWEGDKENKRKRNSFNKEEKAPLQVSNGAALLQVLTSVIGKVFLAIFLYCIVAGFMYVRYTGHEGIMRLENFIKSWVSSKEESEKIDTSGEKSSYYLVEDNEDAFDDFKNSEGQLENAANENANIRTEMPKAKPVKKAGKINVCGTTFSLDMSVSDLIKTGYKAEEVWAESDQTLESVIIYYTTWEEASYDMLYCYLDLKENGDKDNLEDYKISYIALTSYYTVEEKGYYNACIPYGIKTGMKLGKVQKILSQKMEMIDANDPAPKGDYAIEMIGANGQYITVVKDGINYFLDFYEGKLTSVGLYR